MAPLLLEEPFFLSETEKRLPFCIVVDLIVWFEFSLDTTDFIATVKT